jgi:hypothetical protein
MLNNIQIDVRKTSLPQLSPSLHPPTAFAEQNNKVGLKMTVNVFKESPAV